MFCPQLNTYPEYLLDRSILINETYQCKVSGFKLATASEYFKHMLKDIRNRELEKNKVNEDKEQGKKRKRTRSLSEMESECLRISYDDILGLELAILYAHTNDDDQTNYRKYVSSDNIDTIIRASVYFQMPSLTKFCYEFVCDDIDVSKCWLYWKIAKDLNNVYQDLKVKVKLYILENFIEASQSNEMRNISFDDFEGFLKDDKLNVRSEKVLIDIITSWIDHDPAIRSNFFLKLFRCIRLGRLTDESKNSIYNTNKYCQLNMNKTQCQELMALSNLTIEDVLAPTVKVQCLSQNDCIEAFLSMKMPRLSHNSIFVVGGWEGNQDDPNFGPSNAIQVYDPRADIWQRYQSGSFGLDEGHAYSACVSHKSKIYVIGGYTSTGPTQTLKMFDFVAKSWKYLSPMHEKRNYVCASLLNSSIYAIGGHNGRNRLNSVECFDIENNRWSFVASMIKIRSDAGTDTLNEKLYVCGGFDGFTFHSTVEMYNPEFDQWTFVAPMTELRSGVCAVTFGNFLYIIGGNNGSNRLRSVERYCPETDRWQKMPSMLRQRSNFCITVLENKIYVMGGWSDEMNSTIALVESWEPGFENQWEDVMPLFMPASANCCCSIGGLHLIREHLGR